MRVTQMSAFSQSKYKYPEKRNIVKNNNVYQSPANGITKNLKNLLAKFETDDYILAGLIIVLIFEGCDDYVLLAALGYLFIMGFKENGGEQTR